MTSDQAIEAVRNGSLVECTEEEYRSSIREALQDFAAKCAEWHDGIRLGIALSELRRLDKLFNFSLFR